MLPFVPYNDNEMNQYGSMLPLFRKDSMQDVIAAMIDEPQMYHMLSSVIPMSFYYIGTDLTLTPS